MAKITVIPQTINPVTRRVLSSRIKRRVCAYARVSTDSDEQFTSYEAQIDYYTEYIKQNPEWEFVKVYTDEGISGTNTKRRKGFQDMIADALAGKIDLIVTKSVSRFARNTVDTLETIRKLKAKQVEVFFQKENIYTLDSKGELLITIMSSLAQEESRSISENVTWGKRHSFKNGKVSMAWSSFLGYKKGDDGKPEIVPEEALIVRRIYEEYISGKTESMIAEGLTQDGIKTPSKKDIWATSTVLSILRNEKYKGDALLQKTFIVDFLSHKTKKNEGEIPQYYVENSHEGIIEKSEWEMVQMEIARRESLGRSYSGKNQFACKVYCGDCGCLYGPKVWHSNTIHRKEIWQCNFKFKNERQCETPSLKVEEIEQAFIKAYNKMQEHRDSIIEDCKDLIARVTKTSKLDKDIAKLQSEVDVIVNEVNDLVYMNNQDLDGNDSYDSRYKTLEKNYNLKVKELEELTKEKEKRESKAQALNVYLDILEHGEDILDCWDAKVFNLTIEKAIITRNRTIEFSFYNGANIKVDL